MFQIIQCANIHFFDFTHVPYNTTGYLHQQRGACCQMTLATGASDSTTPKVSSSNPGPIQGSNPKFYTATYAAAAGTHGK